MSSHTPYNIILIACLYFLTALIAVSLWGQSDPIPLPRLVYLAIIFSAVITLSRYVLYTLLGSYFGLTHKKRRQKNDDYHPLVSVIIPAWNEEVGILNTVSSILASSYKNIEVIVINDGSTDNSDAKIMAFLKTYFAHAAKQRVIPIIYRYIPNGGKSNALNTALAIAQGEIVITIDADCQVRPDTIQEFVKVFADPLTMAAVGTVKIGNVQTLWGLLQRLEYVIGFYFKRADAVMHSIYIIGGAAGAFRKSVFKTLGSFRTDHITEDTEITLRIQKAGLKIAYAAHAIVYTEGASTLAGLIRQRLRWKRGRFDAFLEHRDLFFSHSKKHRKLLGWFVMPFALFGDVHILLELPFLVILMTYGIVSRDFMPLFSSLAILAGITSLQIISSERGWNRAALILLAPISWWLLLIITGVEVIALTRALWSMRTGKDIRWQRWQRVGLPASVVD